MYNVIYPEESDIIVRFNTNNSSTKVLSATSIVLVTEIKASVAKISKLIMFLKLHND